MERGGERDLDVGVDVHLDNTVLQRLLDLVLLVCVLRMCVCVCVTHM